MPEDHTPAKQPSDKQVTIYSAASPAQAYMLRQRLHDEGIEAMVFNESLNQAAGGLPLGSATTVTVVVGEFDAVRAREFALAFDERIRMSPSGQLDTEQREFATDDPTAAARTQVYDAWPSCPRCSKGRQAVCPYCQTAGSRFVAADEPPQLNDNIIANGNRLRNADPLAIIDAGDARDTVEPRAPNEARDTPAGPAVICPTCDEPFEPRYLRVCEWCGHDFGEGVESARNEQMPMDPIDGRLIVFVAALTTFVVAVVWYFAYVLRR